MPKVKLTADKKDVVEIRSFEMSVVEDADGPKIEGYAAVFDAISEDLGGFREVIRPGAFTKTLAEIGDLHAFVNHDRDRVLGRLKAKTLHVEQDERGLKYSIRVPDTTWARDLLVSMERGDITQSSFAFRAIRDEYLKASDGGVLRELREVSLRGGDVSVVTMPAYPSTVATVRRDIAAAYASACAGTLDRAARDLLASWLDSVAPPRSQGTERHPIKIELAKRKLRLAELRFV